MTPHPADHETHGPLLAAAAALRGRLPRRSPEALTLAALLAGAAAILFLAVAFPMSARAPVQLAAALGVVALAMAAGTLALGDRLPRGALLAQAALAIVLNSLIVAASHTAAGVMADAIAYAWLTVYVALFFPSAIGWFAVLVAAGFGAGILVTGLPGLLTGWIVMTATAASVGLVLSRLSRAVQRRIKTDLLTGVLNRGGLETAAGRAFERSSRRTEALSIAVLDLDSFKAVNDREGHAGGDRLLVGAASAWRAALRGDDFLARTGGDEFVLVMARTPPEQAEAVLERLRRAHPVRWSAGVTAWRPGESLESCLARADAQLYAAKAARRP
jgi:diguanylate cyclase (GGDEF)-like protein